MVTGRKLPSRKRKPARQRPGRLRRTVISAGLITALATACAGAQPGQGTDPVSSGSTVTRPVEQPGSGKAHHQIPPEKMQKARAFVKNVLPSVLDAQWRVYIQQNPELMRLTQHLFTRMYMYQRTEADMRTFFWKQREEMIKHHIQHGKWPGIEVYQDVMRQAVEFQEQVIREKYGSNSR